MSTNLNPTRTRARAHRTDRTAATSTRAHRVTRLTRAKAIGSPAPVVDPKVDTPTQTAPKVTRTLRTADSDDHLAAYFRQLAEHDLLTPEDERELSQGIEDTEVMTWERVLARPDVVVHILGLVTPNFEQPVSFPKLEKGVE